MDNDNNGMMNGNNKAKRLIDILRNSGVNTNSDPNAGGNIGAPPQANTGVPTGVNGGQMNSLPMTAPQTQNPGAMPMPMQQQPTQQYNAGGQVTIPGDQDFEAKKQALQRLQNGQGNQ